MSRNPVQVQEEDKDEEEEENEEQVTGMKPSPRLGESLTSASYGTNRPPTTISLSPQLYTGRSPLLSLLGNVL